ncbi:MAG: hypothetical protein A2Z16_15680 [Chloroflexi bacterium RBG_16_54_18]|nr:MAG: hypothetical protein A2Z16_15680 [Chloroflexi bacterium RBG_16_54_18]
MSTWQLFAGLGTLINDFLALMSAIGSAFMLFSPSRTTSFADLGVLAFLLGVVCQAAMIATDSMPDRIGFFRLSPELVNTLFGVALIFLILKLFISLMRTRGSSL